jgi:WD40 repeat protein
MWVQEVPGITHLAFSHDGRTLYALAPDGRATVWDIMAQLTAWDLAARTSRPVGKIPVWSVADGHTVCPLADGQRIVLLNKVATVLDANTGQDLGGVRGLTEHKSGLRRVTPDGRLFYLKTGGVAVAVWNLTTRESEPSRAVPKKMTRGLRCFDISTDERAVALVGMKGVVTVFDWGDGPELRNPRAITDAADDVRFAPDGRTLAVFSGRQVRMWDVARAAPRGAPADIDTGRGDATFAFHPTAPVFVAPDRDKHPTLFGTETGEAVRSLDFELGRDVTCICFSPDGLTCAAGGGGGRFAVFDVDV